MKQVHIIISGRVQGILFRANTKGIATKLGLKGFVRNLDDGQVEVVAQGKDKELQQLIHFCKMGPPIARVDKADVKYEDVKEKFADFEIRYG